MSIVDVQTGEVKTGDRNTILKSNGIGSCVVVAAIDSANGIGALAHIMLPGKAPPTCPSGNRTRYAEDGIDEMLKQMLKQGSNMDSIQVCLIGAGNVLKREDDSICRDNIKSVTSILEKRDISIKVMSLGGYSRRCTSIDIANGWISCSVGDNRERVIFKA